MKILSVFVLLILSLFLLGACSDKEKERPQVPETNANPDEEAIPSNTESEDDEVSRVSANTWCLPSQNAYGSLTYITVGLQENYLIEGKAYAICEEKLLDSNVL